MHRHLLENFKKVMNYAIKHNKRVILSINYKSKKNELIPKFKQLKEKKLLDNVSGLTFMNDITNCKYKISEIN